MEVVSVNNSISYLKSTELILMKFGTWVDSEG
jgi:hypothetical protein